MYNNLGELATGHNLLKAGYRSQPNSVIVTNPFNPNSHGNLNTKEGFEARYGLGSFDSSTKKGPLYGEDLVIDAITDINEQLGLPPNYKLTDEDVTDLRYVVGLLPLLKDLYHTYTGKVLGVGDSTAQIPTTPTPSTPPVTPPTNPPVTPPVTPTTPSDSDTDILRAKVVKLQQTLATITPSVDVTNSIDLIKKWDVNTTIGPGRLARLRRLARYVDMVKDKIEETQK